MQVADLRRKKKRRRINRGKVSSDSQPKSVSERRKDNDPLQSFDGELDNLGIEEQDGEEDFEDPMVDESNTMISETPRIVGTNATTSKVVLRTNDGTGRSTSGRNAWKEKRRKGKFSKRFNKSKKAN